MLTRIVVKNLAIVSALELELAAGMSVLSGETGAGKSILIDALGLTLGERADTGLIRPGCERAEVTAVFDVAASPRVRELLCEQDLESGDECILRRVITPSGSRAYVNGSPAPAKLLQALGGILVDIHGQHAHQSLLRRDEQRLLLDEFAHHPALVTRTAEGFRAWRRTEDELRRLREASRDRSDRLDLLRFQVEELQALNLQPDEIRELDEQHRRLSNAGRLLEGCNRLLEMLEDDEQSAGALVTRAAAELDELAEADRALEESRALIENAAIQIEEGARGLRHYADHLELDPQRLAEAEQRLSAIHDLSRKYRCPPEVLPERLAEFETELDQLQNADVQLAGLETEADRLRGGFLTAAGRLHESRRKAARKLEKAVMEGMQQLGMPGGRFEVGLDPLPEGKAGAAGLDRIEYRVSANPGQPLQSLTKVASGGELSRISLVIQVATAGCTGVPTLIFDEVDVGIGGGVAEVVGQLLRRLGHSRQVLCVTHLPQVAAQGHSHLQVAKQSDGRNTSTAIAPLDPAGRVEEIARMLGGMEITSQTRAHAREMLDRAQGA